MEAEEKLLFLSNFPTFRQFQNQMYRKRRELIPPNPKTTIDLDVHLQEQEQAGDLWKG